MLTCCEKTGKASRKQTSKPIVDRIRIVYR
jgi:hypothetical protein